MQVGDLNLHKRDATEFIKVIPMPTKFKQQVSII